MEKLKATWRGLKTWQKGIVIFLALALIGAVMPKEEEATPTAKPEPQAKAPAPAPAEPVKEQPKPFAEGELTEDTVIRASGLKGITKVDITADASAQDKRILRVTYAMPEAVNEDDAIYRMARDSVKVMEKLFAHPGVSEVGVWAEGTFTDQYGKETINTVARVVWSRATAEKVEWKNFSNMIVTEPKRALLLGEHYWIHPSVYNGLKDRAGFPASK